MKIKKTLLGCLALLAVSLGLVACDDDEVKMTPTSTIVAGSYTGTVSMAFAYGSLEYEGKTVTLTANGDYAVDITLNDDDLGIADIKAVKVEYGGDGIYSLVETEGVLSMPTHDGGKNDYACLVSGTISEDRNDFNIVFSIPSVMNGTTYTLSPASAE